MARQQAATRPADPTVQRIRRRYDRFENRRLVELLQTDTTQSPNAGPTADALRTAPDPEPVRTPELPSDELSLVRRILGLKEITERALLDLVSRIRRTEIDRRSTSSLEQRVENLQERVEQLEDQNEFLREALEDAQLETEVARIDLDEAHGKIRWLEDRLTKAGDYEAQYLDVPAEYIESPPSSFDELLDRLDDIETVEFTGDTSEVVRLNQIDTNGSALRTAWDAILAMADYARARADGACEGGLAQYLQATPAGYRTFPPGKFGENETGRTMKQFGDERVFRVPSEVDPSGSAEMKAHFKLARIGMASPRMYVLDAHPTIPKLYIGYIGSHLTNTQTN